MGFPVTKRCKESIDCEPMKVCVCMSTYLDILWSHDQEPQWVFLPLKDAMKY